MKNLIKITFLLMIVITITSCGNKRERKIQYMSDTDMYTSVPYDTYSTNPVFKDGISAQLPVAGTVSRSTVVYEYPFTEEGYTSAKENLKSPIPVNEKNMAKGKHLFTIYCTICHGDTGEGMGPLVQNEKFLGVPNYKDREITEGSIYHVIMYGRNMMGSHASQLNDKERWQVVQYVQKLRSDLIK
jgi:mono/diheme cytochrome c family protein